MAKNRLFRGILLTLAFMLCMTGVIGEIRRASAEETSEIVSSYPYTTVTKVKVNLREARSVKSGLVKRIPAEAEITVYEKNGNWARVEYNGSKGWVRTEYIVLKTVKKVTVTPTPTPAPTPAPEKDAGGYVVLKKGSKGAEVQALQEALIELGFLTGKADGNFGDATEKAVIAFQQRNKYPDTGLMDANIQAFLYSGSPLNAKGTATKINTVSPAAGATMRLNNTGEPVGQLQTMLQNLGYYTGTITKRYDMATRAAVTAFQKKNGLKADGVAGAKTRSLLESGAGLPSDATPAPTATPTPKPTKEPVYTTPKSTVKNGSNGADARSVQTRLKDLGYYQGKVDGKFGRASVNALKNFQTNNGLKADGVAGKSTYAKLFSAQAVAYNSPETESPAPVEDTTETDSSSESSFWTTLRSGDSGTDVKQLQENLIQLGYMSGKPDGKYGDTTTAAVKAFQKANNLKDDGTAGPETLKAIYSGTAKATSGSTDSSAAKTTTTLKRGSTGADVKNLQSKLIEMGYLTGKADGIFGSKTTAAVKAFQKANQLKADGVAGAKTLQQLEKGGTAASSTAKPTATATPAPTAVPGGTEALAGRPSASRVIYANWYTTVKDVCKKYPYATVYDYSTGISWQVHIFSVGAHADCEPVSASDTAKMIRAFGGETTWTPKPVWVIFADGSVYMGSTHDTPHGTSHISNNFDGHTCIHFPRTQAQVEAIGPYATSHQETIDQGWAATRRSGS